MSVSGQGSVAPYISRFVTLFNKLSEECPVVHNGAVKADETVVVQGQTPAHIGGRGGAEAFWSELLSLDVDRTYLSEKLNSLPKGDCLGRLKPLFETLFSTCLEYVRTASNGDAKRSHAVQLMTVATRCLLSKSDLAGWEVMELFAGGVNQSDKFFNVIIYSADTVSITGTLFSGASELRHEVLQLAVVFMCGINQLSPGAYLLRGDLFPAILSMIRGPETGRFTFEAMLLLALLSNFHKSDASKLNPFLRHIGEIADAEALRKVCWAAEFAAATAVKAYQDISEDSPPTMSSMIGSFVTSLRPDRAFSSTPVNTPRELFKHQPIEACVILLPILELSLRNRTFHSIFVEGINDSNAAGNKSARPPLPHTIISLSSYLLTHATSTSSSRAIGYANVASHILLASVESDVIIRAFCEPSPRPVRLCRQRLPILPSSPIPRPLICAVLDCCILWLRHNLHKRLETSLYLTCMRTCHRTIWFLQKEHIRPDYHWLQLWKAIIGLLDFLGSKLGELSSTVGIGQLVQESLVLLDIVSTKADAFLPSPQAIHEFMYELVRSALALQRLTAPLRSFITPQGASGLSQESSSEQALSHLLSLTNFYEEKVGLGNHSANDAMRIIAKEIERDGIHTVGDPYVDDPPRWSDGVTIFLRHAYSDGMALMP
ncbi:hypothetical protein F5148DRAFT_973492 [Russula earlei]|uniref:Uncharacterized protein n=1 Tax=Russula earlei TaxID=71964 RepID=A0ACC0UMS6_9AGAM|nr:hypothetical protein F5148DRAFT_973492 [Russula earlei]